MLARLLIYIFTPSGAFWRSTLPKFCFYRRSSYIFFRQNMLDALVRQIIMLFDFKTRPRSQLVYRLMLSSSSS
ncbi:hypothetical protein F4782DRAFT_506841 [Xylaria castorea]|nr:hypothetical protein F4782DRAFT_506841 [Xylaria castorea]